MGTGIGEIHKTMNLFHIRREYEKRKEPFLWRFMTTKNTRVDDVSRAYAGSQLQIQLYVNRRSEELSREAKSQKE